ncbi:MAG: hypothetical protein JRG91_13825 [Deltaproteobacteria bacterium]|nr:hypothetical protein [Deltaproteobacteria bacterium]
MRGTSLALLAAVLLCGCDEGGWAKDADTDEAGDVVSEDTAVEPEAGDVDDERRCTTDEDCEDGNPCTDNRCLYEDDRCYWVPYDMDGDGFMPATVDEEDCGGRDCDDSDPDINPDAERQCDAVDHDCDGFLDNDQDGDTYASELCGGDDCDDADGSIHPDATELCDLIDQDCDDSLIDAPNADDDGDLHLDDACGGDDCDDARDDTYLGAAEVCGDGIDQDCNGYPDDATTPILADVRVTSDGGASKDVSLVWSGSEYGVAWNDDRDGNWEIYFARIDDAGARIGSDLRVTDAVTSSRHPELVWSGSQYGLTWYDHRDGNEEIYFARLGGDGAKIGADARITDDTARSRYPDIAWADDAYALTWTDERDGNEEIYFARLDDAGAKMGSDVMITFNAFPSMDSALTWTGTEYGLVWRDDRDGNGEIYFVRVSAAGAKVGSESRVTNATNASGQPQIVWTGSEYGVTWHDNRDDTTPMTSPYVYEIYFARILPDGTKNGLDSRITTTSNTSWYPSLVWMTSTYAATWHDRRDGNGETYFARITAVGSMIIPDVRITSDVGESWNPSIVWTGSEFGVSWDDDRDGNEEIYFNRINLCE